MDQVGFWLNSNMPKYLINFLDGGICQPYSGEQWDGFP